MEQGLRSKRSIGKIKWFIDDPTWVTYSKLQQKTKYEKPVTNAKSKVYFISDAHLRADQNNPEAEKKLVAVLRQAKTEASHVYIVGDLFDFWFEYRFAIPAAYLKTIAALLDLTESGVKVVYLPGNHDFWMRDYLHRQAGVELASDTLDVYHFDKRIFLIHGDGLRKDDVGYRFIKRIFRNKVCIWLYSQLPVNLAYRLAMGTSHASRDYTTSRKKNDPSDYIEYARKKVAEGYDAVVMGHVHLAQIEKVGKGLYINCGEFFQGYSYVVLDEAGFRLCKG
jgi:UDP-2,3-diacylglucosamine hydrolase